MKLRLPIVFLVQPFFKKGFTSSKQLPWRQGLSLSKKHSGRNLQYNTWKDELGLLIKFKLLLISLHAICFERKNVTASKKDASLFRCLNHMERYIAHIQKWPISFKHTTYAQEFYFTVMLLHEFQSNGSLACEGGFPHTCTNIFLKEYHNHCLKWVLKGFLSEGILHRLSSRNVLLYSMKFCKKWCYASTIFYTSFKIQSAASILYKYCCINWGILCKNKVAFSWRNAPPCSRNTSLFTMEHCKK